eukprot:scaffold49175_cov23-Tisochrysis_lutea.AAC.1
MDMRPLLIAPADTPDCQPSSKKEVHIPGARLGKGMYGQVAKKTDLAPLCQTEPAWPLGGRRSL